ncbi:hypothetical protein HK405_007778, partial [Cladochytrium tenue]
MPTTTTPANTVVAVSAGAERAPRCFYSTTNSVFQAQATAAPPSGSTLLGPINGVARTAHALPPSTVASLVAATRRQTGYTHNIRPFVKYDTAIDEADPVF